MFHKYHIIIFGFFIFLSVLSCKQKGSSLDFSTERDWKSEWKDYERLMEKEPGFNNFQTGILKISQMLVDTHFTEDHKEILTKGIELCTKNKNTNYALIFKKEYAKAYPEDKNTEKYLLDYTASLDEDKNELEVKLLYDGISKRWPNNKKAKENANRIKRNITEFDFFLNETGKQMFGSPEVFKIDSARVEQYISLCEHFVLAYPNEQKAASLLMMGAQAAKTGKNPQKAIELFDWVWRYFPQFSDAPLALFLKGFTYETDLGQKEFAIDAYKTFLKKYPKDKKIKEVQFLLDNIHKSESELLKKVEN